MFYLFSVNLFFVFIIFNIISSHIENCWKLCYFLFESSFCIFRCWNLPFKKLFSFWGLVEVTRCEIWQIRRMINKIFFILPFPKRDYAVFYPNGLNVSHGLCFLIIWRYFSSSIDIFFLGHNIIYIFRKSSG